MSACLIIFGAAVRADGKPSGTLARRILGALEVARGLDDAVFLATGGAGDNGIVEADVIGSRLSAAGIDPSAIIFDRDATDTFDSIVNCDRLLRTIDVDWVAACTSRYHVPRCKLLLRVLGWKVRAVHMPSDWGHVPTARLVSYYLKEFVSTPYDLLLVALYRLRNGSGPRHDKFRPSSKE